jgi:protein ImuB
MFACLHLPNFYLQAALRWRGPRQDIPAVVVNEESAKGIVLQLNQAAVTCGIHPGMTPPQAMARAANVLILRRSLDQEHCLNQLLLDNALSLSPLVELTGPGLCIADLGKTSAWKDQLRNSGGTTSESSTSPRMLANIQKQDRAVVPPGGEMFRTVADLIVARLNAGGLHAAIGIAPTPDLAPLAARAARSVLLVENVKAFTANLPLDALDPPENLRAILVDWGIERVGQLMSLPRSELVERLGNDAHALLKRVSPRNKRPLRLFEAAPEYFATFDFEYEVDTTEPLLFLLRRFLDDLCERIRGAYRVAEKLVLRIPLGDGSQYERVFCIPAPTADVDTLFRVLNTHLESLQLEQRPVGVRLQIEPGLPSRAQLSLFEATIRDPNQFGETLARLKALAGNDRVGVPAKMNTHQPDRFVLCESFADSPGAPASPATPSAPMANRGLPMRRYRPPIAGSVQTESDHPASIE